MSEENLIVEQEEVVDAIMETVIHDENEPVVSTKRLLEAGCHFGHQTRRWNPKMAQYIYGSRNGVYIIDLVRTAQKIQEAYQALKKIVLNGGKVLFVGTKKQCQEIIQEEALRSGSFYVATRWLGGTLTNFKTIQKRIKYLNNLEVMEEDGSFDSMPKKEAVKLRKEKEKLLKNLDGIKAMRKVPNAIFVVDPKLEHNAVAEARKLKIPVFAICDTNSDPTEVDYAIPSNDDAVKAIKLIVGLLADAVVEAKGGQTVVAYGVQPDEEVSMIDALNSFDKAEELKQIRQKAREDMLASKRKDGRPRPTRKSTAKYEQKVEEAKVEAPAEAKEETSVETTEEVKPIKKVNKVAKKTEEVKEEATEEAKVETTEEVKPTKKVSKAAKKVEDKTDTLVEAKEEVTEKAKPTKTVGKVAKKTEEVKEAKVAETTEVKSTKKTSKVTKKTEEVKEEATEEAKPVKKVRKTTKKVEETLVENKE